ncbi:MAG: hypothetical protein ABFC78_00060 [Methanoregula sp.]
MIKQDRFGIVVMLDALGVSYYSLDQCRGFLKKQNEMMISINNTKKFFKDYGFFKGILTATFGDTVVICYPIKEEGKNSHSCLEILGWVGWHLSYILNLGIKNGILFRGSVSIGEFLYENNIVLGPAIFDAHEWYESADWCGVLLTPKIQLWLESALEEEKRKESSDAIGLFEYGIIHYPNVPLSHRKNKKESEEFWVIAWPAHYYYMGKKSPAGPLGDLSKDLYKIPISKLGETKFKNSIGFFKWYGKEIYEKNGGDTENNLTFLWKENPPFFIKQ